MPFNSLLSLSSSSHEYFFPFTLCKNVAYASCPQFFSPVPQYSLQYSCFHFDISFERFTAKSRAPNSLVYFLTIISLFFSPEQSYIIWLPTKRLFKLLDLKTTKAMLISKMKIIFHRRHVRRLQGSSIIWFVSFFVFFKVG